MSDPYLDALEQLDQMRDRAFKAEATIKRVRYVVNTGSFARPDLSDWESGYNQALKDVWMEMEEGE